MNAVPGTEGTIHRSGAHDPAEAPRPRWVLSAVSAALAAVVVFGGFFLTDDAWPFAPLRMFSYGNNPNGVVRTMHLEGHAADHVEGNTAGRHVVRYADDFGLRRAELEEQTPWDKRVPDAKLGALASTYNDRNPDHPLIHLQVVVRTTQMRNGEPAGEPTESVIGDWATPAYRGPRVDVDLPLASPWPGYGK